MENNKEQLEAISEIKALMERSSRFVSLSGMSGIAAGFTAIAGIVTLCISLKTGILEQVPQIMLHDNYFNAAFIFLIALSVFILSLALAVFFSARKAKKKKIIFWDIMAKRVFINHFIFLSTGGIFSFILFYYGIYFLIVPSMLIFYGLALVNISKFIFNEIAQLGIVEILLGISSAFVPIYPLLSWLIGFGILHLIYGMYVHIKYEKG